MNDSIRCQAETLCHVLYDKKAQDILAIPVAEKTVLADWLVICSGRAVPQIRALSDDLEDKAAEAGLTLLRKEGYDDARWIVLDYGSILVHIFHPDERKFYNLERLWDTDASAIVYGSEQEETYLAAHPEAAEETPV